MILLKCGSHRIRMSQGLEFLGSNIEGYEFQVTPSKSIMAIDQDGLSTKFLGWKKKDSAIYLKHLDSPENGKGFGKLGIAIFWVIAKVSGAERFAIRFGGGESSYKFLSALGFPRKGIHRISDQYSWNKHSVAVGRHSDNPKENRRFKEIEPIPLNMYPTEFFEVQEQS